MKHFNLKHIKKLLKEKMMFHHAKKLKAYVKVKDYIYNYSSLNEQF